MRQDILVRALPFAVYILFLALGHRLVNPLYSAFDIRWLYALKSLLVAALLVNFIHTYGELRLRPRCPSRFLWGASALGIVVFILWIHLDQGLLNLGSNQGFDPREPITGRIVWPLAAFRLAGATLVVPIMEELFWRSFLLRWIDRHDFLNLSPGAVSLKAILLSSVVFGFSHALWFAGIVAGLAYSWLYRISGNLWAPILAHAMTNFLLGVWVLQTGNWQFW